MSDQPITINLPQSVYERLKRAAEQATLAALMQAAQALMLRKAEARRLLTQRRHTVFAESAS